jgi:hypothetical protein
LLERHLEHSSDPLYVVYLEGQLAEQLAADSGLVPAELFAQLTLRHPLPGHLGSYLCGDYFRQGPAWHARHLSRLRVIYASKSLPARRLELYDLCMNQAQAARDQIAAEVRAELARQKMSVSEAARQLGWTQSFLQRRVMGDRGFEASELAAVAGLLDVPVQVFFEGPGNVRDLARSRGPEDAFYGPAAVAA